MRELRRPAAVRFVGEPAQGAFAVTGAGAFGAGAGTFAAIGRGAGAAVAAGAIGTATGLATATAGGGVIFGTVITLPAKAGVPRDARPSTPTVDSAVMRRNRLVILRSFQRSVSPERIGADQRGSAMTRPRPVWRRRVSKHEFRILICFALLESNVAKQIPDRGTRSTTGSVVRWRRPLRCRHT